MKNIFKTVIEKIYLSFDDNLAYTDDLVKCKNKNYWLNYCINKFKDQEIYLCVIDVNNLKVINDTFGHNKGDLYLREMTDLFKKYGTTIRFGGDEFAIIFQGSHKKDNLEKFVLMANSDMRIAYGLCDKKKNQTLSQALEVADGKMYNNKLSKKSRYRDTHENQELSSAIVANRAKTYLRETEKAEQCIDGSKYKQSYSFEDIDDLTY